MISDSKTATPFVRWFDSLGIEDVPLVGGKNASLGEMTRELSPHGVRLANGFAVTADAYRLFLRETGLGEQIQDLLAGRNLHDVAVLQKRGRRIREAIIATVLPGEVSRQIVDAYDKLSEGSAEPLDVAVPRRPRL